MTVSIEMVAKRAGVASSTVSLVLRNKPRVAPATHALVMAAVKELGYKKGSPGRPRKKPGDPISPKRTNRIALVVPDITSSKLYTPVYVDVLQGVEKAIHDARKAMVLRHVKKGDAADDEILPTRVDGVLIFGEVQNPKLLKQLNGIPTVQLMHAAQRIERWDRVTYDNSRIGALAAEYAQSKGHTCAVFVGHICGREDYFLQQRGLDFKAGLLASGAKVHFLIKDLLLITDRLHTVQRDVIDAVVSEILALNPRPTALFAEADMVTQALYPALQARGIIPGRDIELISCNNEQPLLAQLSPRPVTVDIHAGKVGRKAVERLLWRVEHPSAPVETILLEPTLVESNEADGR